jgi:hypothetical protein
MLFTKGYPGYTRGVAASGSGEFIVTTATGRVARYRPDIQESEVLVEGLDQLYGVAIAPNGAVVCAEQGRGRVVVVHSGNVETLVGGLNEPSGVAVGRDGECYVAESASGRVIKATGSGFETVIDGLQQPQGILVREDQLYIVDVDAKELIAYDLRSGTRITIAAALPVGAPPGIVPKFQGPVGTFCGPTGPFAAITAGQDGTLYLSGDAEGSVLAVSKS